MEKRCRLLSAIVGMFQIVSLVSCASIHPSDEAQMVRMVFKEFLYVGAFPAVQYAPPPHAHDSVDLPRTFQSNTLYVFHHAGPLDDAAFAVDVLPDRLRSAGATLMEAPTSKADMPSVDPGDKMWRVVFRYGRVHWVIYNALDKGLFQRGGIKPGGNVNSFVLRVER